MATLELCHRTACSSSSLRVGRVPAPVVPRRSALHSVLLNRPLRDPYLLPSSNHHHQISLTVCAASSAALDGSLVAPYGDQTLTAPFEEYVAGQVLTVHSRAQLEDFLNTHKQQLVVLMCKASHCRPCKMFSRKYGRLAEKLVDTAFLDIIGDETSDTRSMMLDMNVKATPTFRIYRGHQFITALTGSNEKKLTDAVVEHLLPSEAGYAPQVEEEASSDS